jgi:hypothetical protein
MPEKLYMRSKQFKPASGVFLLPMFNKNFVMH